MTDSTAYLFLDTGDPAARQTVVTTALRNALVATAYVLTGYAGLKLSFVGGSVTLFWPPSGIAFAALWLGGMRLLPGVAFGAFAVNIITSASIEFTLLATLGNTLFPLAAMAAMREMDRRRPLAGELMRVLRFLLIAVLGCTVISATIGTTAVQWLNPAAFVSSSWLIWWMGDAMGVLVIATPILLWQRTAAAVGTWRGWIDASAFAAAASGIIAGLVLVNEPIWATELFKLFTLLLTLWAGARFGMMGPAAMTLVMTMAAVAVTVSGIGPFARGSFYDNFALVHSYLFAAAVAGMLLSAAIADLRRALEREQRALTAAEASSANRIRSMTMISHDVRTPLSGIMGVLQVLARSSLPAKEDALVRVGLRAGVTMTSLIASILDVARLDLGTITLNPAPFDVRRSLQDVIDIHRTAASTKGLDLRLELDSELPQSLVGDRVRFEQLIGNLVSNALSYTDDGHVAVYAGWKGVLVVEAVDTGPGVDGEAAVHIFEPFVRAHTGNSIGLGLGLYICRHIAGLMGGIIEYQRGADCGSCFHVELPLPIAAECDLALEKPIPTDTQQRILLVEDDEIAREATAALLASHGHLVNSVANAIDALAALQTNRFDLVLTDIMLGARDASGVRLASDIRVLPPPAGSTPIIALTGDGVAANHAQYLAAGIDGVLVKPLDLSNGLANQLAAARNAPQPP